MEMLTWVLGGVATILNIIGYVIYNKMTATGNAKPHFASWSIWLFMELLNLMTILHATSLAQALQYAVGFFLLVATLSIAIWKGGITWPKWSDSFAFLICPMIIGALVMKDPVLISAAFLIGFAVSFYPTFLGVYMNPASEHPVAWYVWTAALGISVLNGMLSWGGDAVAVLNPAILFACNVVVLWFCSPWMKRVTITALATIRGARLAV